jgi:beta-lactamase class A
VSPTEASTEAATTEFDPEIADAIETLLDGQRGVYGIVLMQPDGTIEYELNADTPFLAASLYKLVLLANIYEKREKGELTFDQEVQLLPDFFPEPGDFVDSFYDETMVGATPPIEELVFATGAYSSNVAAKALLSLTDTPSLDQTTIDLGLNDTYLFIDPTTLPAWKGDPDPAGDLSEALTFVAEDAETGPVNITTPHDMSRFFQLLLDGKVINETVSDDLLEVLSQQAVDDRFPILLPYPTDMAHKTGNLDHVVHDVGIIWTPDGPIILAAMIEDPPNDDLATQVIQRLALIAYGDYDVPPFTEQAVPAEGSEEPPPDEEEAPAEEG